MIKFLIFGDLHYDEVADGGSVTSALNGKHAIVCETKNSSVSIQAGAQPAASAARTRAGVSDARRGHSEPFGR